jgi:hypothetical protein
MAGKEPERKPKGAGQYRKGKKTVGIYERPKKKDKRKQLTLLLAIIIILAMVLSLIFVGR